MTEKSDPVEDTCFLTANSKYLTAISSEGLDSVSIIRSFVTFLGIFDESLSNCSVSYLIKHASSNLQHIKRISRKSMVLIRREVHVLNATI